MSEAIVTEDGWALDGDVWRRDGEERTAVRAFFDAGRNVAGILVMPDATVVGRVEVVDDIDASLAEAADILRGYIRWRE